MTTAELKELVQYLSVLAKNNDLLDTDGNWDVTVEFIDGALELVDHLSGNSEAGDAQAEFREAFMSGEQ